MEATSVTRQAINELIPESCDCTEIRVLATAYDDSVQAGHMTHDQAVAGFSDTIRADCEGKVFREEAETELSCFADSCSIPKKVCKHGKYLIAMSRKVSPDGAL
ncbi:MAG TPA: hypothetical protein VFH37_01060 [Candidatus Saccharimonadales bacterium]|nr:hypothetical protein [Candidatus Saccharimonadales bacterium]